MNKQVMTASADTESKLPRFALQRSMLQTPKTPNLSSLKTEKDIYACLESFELFSINGGTRNQVNQEGEPSIPSRRPLGVQLLPCVLPWQLVLKRSGEPKPAKSARKDTSTRSNKLCPCCLTSPLAVYAKTFSSSSIRDRFSKSAFRPKDYKMHPRAREKRVRFGANRSGSAPGS